MTVHGYPAWVRDSVFYQIIPDRFGQSARLSKPPNLEPWDAPPTFHGFKGGDLLGVAERLDYLQDLGINGLYFTPVFQSTANHRYHTCDYMQADPLLGGNSALRELLDAAHGRNMRVVLDGVFNHSGRGFFPFSHVVENGESSPYRDWFHIDAYPLNAYDETRLPSYAAWWNLHALPKLNTGNPAVRRYLMNVTRKWLEFGIDGWRLDVPAEIRDDSFWQEFRGVAKTARDDAYLVGEIWQDAQRWLRGDMFDGVMNYPVTRACIEFFIGARGDPELWANGYGEVVPSDAPEFAAKISTLLAQYSPQVSGCLLNLLGSHDTARFLSVARGDASALRLALLFQMTYPGAPCVYYGDEVGMSGGRDPECRAGMVWDEGRWDAALRDYFRQCIALRHAHPSLRGGGMTIVMAEGMTIAYARYTSDEVMVVAINAGTSTWVGAIPTGGLLPDGALLQDVWSRSTVGVSGGVLPDLKLPPRSGIVLVKA